MSVVDALGETLGVYPRVLLREADTDHTPIGVDTKHLSKPDAKASGGSVRSATSGGAGRYQLAGEIARGGVGVILKGRDPDIGRDVAVKMLRAEHAGRPSMVQRFVEEAQITGQLQHPGILPVYELGLSDERRPFFTMKLIKGETLARLLADREQNAVERRKFLTYFEHVCQATAYAHAKGVVHRDLKPSNIMIGSFGEVQLVDWGLAKVLRRGGLADEPPAGDPGADESVIETVRTASGKVSMVGSIMGTPAYMSPEQARGDIDQLDERSDVFALGAILFEILTGSPPYVGTRDAAIQAAANCRLEGTFAKLDACGADAELIRLTKRCMSRDPADRPRDAEVVAREVSTYLASLEQRAREAELSAAKSNARAEAERKSRRVTLALSVVIILTLLFGGGAAFWVVQERDARREKASENMETAIENAAVHRGLMMEASVTNPSRRLEFEAALAYMEELLEVSELPEATEERARAFLEEGRSAVADRKLIEIVEEMVIEGASHPDAVSWARMERRIREAFLDYGIDLLNESPEAIAEKMRRSPFSVELTDGIELWIGSSGMHGFDPYPKERIREWVEIVYLADPDPFLTKLRRTLYAMLFDRAEPDPDVFRQVEASKPFEEVRPRALSWLATGYAMAGDFESARRVYVKACDIYPDDFMLNADFTWVLTHSGEFEEAIPYYMRCLAIRPTNSGIWRLLGNAYRAVGSHQRAVDAIERSILFDPNHAATHVDLAIAHAANEDPELSRDAFCRAMTLDVEAGLAYAGRLVLTLPVVRPILSGANACDGCGSDGSEPDWAASCREILAPADEEEVEVDREAEDTGGADRRP
jgi:serine/threonine-protein kinase